MGFKGNQGTLIAPSLTERSSRIKSEVVKGGDGRRHVEGAVEVLEDGTRQGASMHFAARDADGFLATIPQFHERDIPGRTRTFVKFIDFIPNLQKRLDVRHVRHSQIRGGR